MRIIELIVGKKKVELIAGLVWHPLQDSGSGHAKEALAYAVQTESDLKITRGTESPHVGFAKKSEGAKVGQISAAAAIADAYAGEDAGQQMLVALQLPDDPGTYMFVSVARGVILADGDVVGSRDEIRVRFVEAVTFGGWSVIICPGDWGIPNSDDKDFSHFFNEKTLKSPAKWALKETTIAWRKYIAPTIIILAVSIGGAYGWKVWSQKKAQAAAALRLQQEEAARGQRVAPAAPPKPWPLMPAPVAFAKACADALRSAGLTGGNWVLSSITCENGSMVVAWQKPNERAWISHLASVRPDASFAADGMSASVVRPATASPSNDFAEVLPPQHSTRLRLLDLASRYGMAIRIDAAKAPPAPATLPGQMAGAAAPVVPPSWAEFDVLVSTNIDPAQAVGVINTAGFRLKKIAYVYTAGAMQYQLYGVQYVQP
jgi:hypothetical protein